MSVAIIGPSGAGKSWIGAKLGAMEADSIGEQVMNPNGIAEWLIDVTKLPSSGFIQGTGDNLVEWVTAFKPDLVIGVVNTNLEMFSSIMKAKADDLVGKDNFEQGWYDGYLEKSKFTKEELAEYMGTKSQEMLDLAKSIGAPYLEIDNRFANDRITKGWHQDGDTTEDVAADEKSDHINDKNPNNMEKEEDQVEEQQLEDLSVPEPMMGIETISIQLNPDNTAVITYQIDEQVKTEDEYEKLPARIQNLFDLAREATAGL